MQLLQKLRDSSNLETIARETHELESVARALSQELRDFLLRSRGALILYSYTGYGYAPANLMYWYSLTCQSAKHPVMADAEESLIYLAPYRDDLSLVIFSTGEYSKLVAALQATRALGLDYLAIAPDPPTENMRSIMRHYNVRTLPHQDSLRAALVMVLASFFTSSDVFKDSLSLRSRRLFNHGKEGFAPILQSFIERYAHAIEDALRYPNIVVTSSKFFEASSMLLAWALRRSGIAAMYLPLEEALHLAEVPALAIFLSTEERLRREFRAARKGPLVEILLNVDPLEAGVYISLLAYAVSRSM